jgi:magnesium transporter
MTAEFVDHAETRSLISAKAWDDLAEQLSVRPVTDTADVLMRLEDADRMALCRRLASADGPGSDSARDGTLHLLEAPYGMLARRRFGWLALLMIGQMFTATIIDYFDEQLEKALVLALFIPMIISSGGNSGSQASTLLIRAMAIGEVELRDWLRVIYREVIVGGLLGLLLAIVAFARVALFQQSFGEHWFWIGLTLGLATAAVVFFGSLLGSLMPLILRAAKTDPATSSTPFVATLADIGGLIIYFSIAVFILKGTLL